MRYEDLVLNPVEAWQRVFGYLELPFDPDVLTDFAQVKLAGRRDRNMDLPQYQAIRKDPLYKWRKVMANPLRRAWCRRYLAWIGRERLALMGYNLDTVTRELDSLPFSMRFVATDIYRMPCALARRVFELRIMKHKLQAWRTRQRIYAHL